jgi:hypothetical protein
MQEDPTPFSVFNPLFGILLPNDFFSASPDSPKSI